MKNKGFANIALIIIIVLLAAGAGYYFAKQGSKVETQQAQQEGQGGEKEVPTGPFIDSTNYVPQSPNSTKLPKYVGGQANWPPVIQNSPTVYSCTQGSLSGEVAPTTTEKVINGKTYCVTVIAEAAAGSRYGEYTYVTANGTGTKKTNFTLRWPNCGVYGGPGDAEYDQCQTEQTTFFNNLDALIDSLM